MSSFDWIARQRAILAFVNLYCCATLDVLRARFFPGTNESANAAVKVVSRLRRANYLERHPLYGKRRYYKTGARAVELGLTWAKEPFGQIALPRLFAAMAYLNRGSPGREKLARPELQAAYPWLPCHGEATYFHERDALGAVITDLGGADFYLHGKLRRYYDRRYLAPEFRRLLAENRFQLVVVSRDPARSEALRRCLERDPLPLPIVLATLPELIHLTMRFDHAAT